MSTPVWTDLDFLKHAILNGCFQSLATAPSDPALYQYYFDTTDEQLKYWNGTSWETVGTKGAVVFKGTVGTGGTITTLPLNNTAKLGHEYMVCADGTYVKKTGVNQTALIGDLFVCTKAGTGASSTDAEWEYIPSGNDKYKGTITGNGTATSFPITHTLNSTDVSVSIYDSSNKMIIADVTITDANTVTIGFATAPASTDSFSVIILS